MDESMEQKLQQLRNWIESHPNYPQDIGDKLLLRFLHSCYYDEERAKSAIELFFNLRASMPELLNNRDPLSPQMEEYLKFIQLAQIRISKNRNLWIWQLVDPGLEHYDYVLDARLFIMCTDAWLLNNEYLEEADIIIFDIKSITLKFITKFNISVARRLSKYQQDAMPLRLKQIHVVNAPSYWDKIFGLLKPFLKQEINEMIHFHALNSDTLYKYIEKEDLPADYGGELPKLEEHMKNVVNLLTEKRDLLLNDQLWRASDKKNKGHNEVSMNEGSFRSLAID